MTTVVTVTTPRDVKYVAKVEFHDQVEGETETRVSLGGIVPAGETHTFHIHSTREILVSEIIPADASEESKGEGVTAE